MLSMAEASIWKLMKEQSVENLFPAVLMTVHCIEWDRAWKRETKNFHTPEHKAFRERHPEWDILRQIANGMKHAERKVGQPHPHDMTSRLLEWEDADFWYSAGAKGPIWFIGVDDENRVVHALCIHALERFRQELDSR
jgi:hypothetical protein